MASSTLKTAGMTTRKVRYEDVILDWSRNIRERDDAHVDELVKLISVNGLTRIPAVTEEGRGKSVKRYVERGFHTWTAIGVIRETNPDAFDEILVEVVETADEAERRVLHMVEQMAKRDLTEAEIADNVGALKKLGMSRTKISQRLGQPVQWVDRALHFGKNATTELKQLSEQGAISNSKAVDAARLEPAAQREVVADVTAGMTPAAAVDKQRAAKGKARVRSRTRGKRQIAALIDDYSLLERASAKVGKDWDADLSDEQQAALDTILCRAILAGVAWTLGHGEDPEVEMEKHVKLQKFLRVELAEHFARREAAEASRVAKQAERAAKAKAKYEEAAQKRAEKKGAEKKQAADIDLGDDE